MINNILLNNSIVLNAGLAFITDGMEQLGTFVTLIGAGLGTWGIVNLVEGYGGNDPGSKSQGIKQTMAGVGLVLVGGGLAGWLLPLFNL